jgi:hypothetical protein
VTGLKEKVLKVVLEVGLTVMLLTEKVDINLVEDKVVKKEVSIQLVDQHHPHVKVRVKVKNGVKKLHVMNL